MLGRVCGLEDKEGSGGKAQEEAERQRVVEEEERKKRMMEYLQWLQDEVLEEEAEGSQVAGFKHKEIAAGDKEEQWPSKKAREKYCGGAAVKMGGANSCERYVSTGQDCLVYSSRWVFFFILIIIIF